MVQDIKLTKSAKRIFSARFFGGRMESVIDDLRLTEVAFAGGRDRELRVA
ncbi:MAG: hypothetical protein U5K75_02235 [Ahrensia sp.]|nr:hypothetical protein [Ahrensia sp.]